MQYFSVVYIKTATTKQILVVLLKSVAIKVCQTGKLEIIAN